MAPQQKVPAVEQCTYMFGQWDPDGLADGHVRTRGHATAGTSPATADPMDQFGQIGQLGH